MGPQRLVTFVISALEMFLLTYLLTYLQLEIVYPVTLKRAGVPGLTPGQRRGCDQCCETRRTFWRYHQRT